ncbi:MAG: hypothetical protein ITD27_01315, partial [Nitrosospira sp.]|nr:hypothetical protein [Nitrosospira sp.]
MVIYGLGARRIQGLNLIHHEIASAALLLCDIQLKPFRYLKGAGAGTATLGCWRLTRRGGSWWRQMPAGSWGRGVRHPGQRQCAQILA